MSNRLEQLQKLYEVDPDDAFVTYGIAMEYSKQGQAEETLQWLDKTLANDQSYNYAYYQKAKALKALGRQDEAMATVDQGIASAQAAGDAKAVSELQDLKEMLG